MTGEAATIERAYRVRLRPTKVQMRVLSRLFGARRWLWNWAIARKDAAWRADGTKLTGIDLSREFTVLRSAPETGWLGALPRLLSDDLQSGYEVDPAIAWAPSP